MTISSHVWNYLILVTVTISIGSNRRADIALFVQRSHTHLLTIYLCIDERPREANWSKCLCCFVPTPKDGAAQIFIILKRQQHNCTHIAVRYPAAQLEFHCRWQSKKHVQWTNRKWHKIALYWQYWIPKGTATASNYSLLSHIIWNNILL